MKTTLASIIAIMLVTSVANAMDDYCVIGKVLQKLDAGILVQGKIIAKSISHPDSHFGIVFIKGYPESEKLFDGVAVKCRVSDAGTYQYVAITGAPTTVQSFAFSSFPPLAADD